MNFSRSTQTAAPALALSLVLAACLTACGGGSGTDSAMAAPADVSASASPQDSSNGSTDSVAAAIAQAEVQPAYHMAPALLDEPGQDDVGGTNVSARAAPRSFNVDPSVADIDTARLTPQILAQRLAGSAKARVASADTASTAPLATTLAGAVFTPAQIRAAYGLPALPAVGATVTPAVAATLGAGQTIYLLDAFHDASALSDLNLFSTRFGLPTCTSVAVGPSTALPLATPPSRCTFSTVYAATGGAMTSTVPAYSSSWIPESKLDVQWAHAIAPLARIVLIEMPSAMSNSILDGNALAARLGKGVVSMSFGFAEAGWVPTTDYAFTNAGMTYVAAAGDSGSQVLWPAVSPNVVAVGGTGLNYSGTGTRYEAAWAHSGGGLSAYEALPAWQSGLAAAGGGALVRRAVPDVSFNANPMTGEYVALTLPGATSTVWSAYGGTSIAAPQWAGVVAVANAIRVAAGKAMLGDIHTLLYRSIAAVPGSYAAAFGDVVDGTNGTCATCRAGVGFDQATGLGTPTATGLLPLLTGVSTTTPARAAPTISTATLTGATGTPFAASLVATNPNSGTLSYTLTGAPAGLVASASGALSWAAPVAGTYTLTAHVADSLGYASTKAVALTISAVNHRPVVASATLAETAGAAFAVRLNATDPDGDTVTLTATGIPAGATLSLAGILTWSNPVRGTYTLAVIGRDPHGGLGYGTIKLIVS